MLKRLLQITFVIALSFTMLGAGDSSTRFDHLGHQLVCQCGCGQILLECNHVNCPVSAPMIDQLKAQMDSGLPDAGVLNFFIGKYGPVVLAAPIRGGFDNVAWIVPVVIVILGFGLVFIILRTWQAKHTHMAATGALPAAPTDDLRDRIRRDTEDHS
ncbi:MAG: cytochrome c-type biogenesis protein CcmH [Acidobacteriota bacterium]